MDAEALRTFVTVHRAQGFSSAASRLHRTQPAISHRIRLLEEELGVPLFERIAGGVVLSEAGRVLLPHAERALAALEDAEAAVRAVATEDAGALALAAVGTLAGPGLTGVLRRFAEAHPAVDLRLQTARSAEVSELVRRGDAAIGLRYGYDRSPDLRHEELGAEPLLVACPPGHRLSGRSIPALRALAGERWLAFPEPGGPRDASAAHVAWLFASRGLGEVDWTPVDSLTAQKRLVEAGFGLALMTDGGIAEERAAGTLGVIRVRDLGAGLPVCLVTRNGGFLGAAARRMLDLLRRDYPAAWSAKPSRRSRRRR